MQQRILRLLFFFIIAIASLSARSQEARYYTLVIDKIELPSFTKDTTATTYFQLSISFDDDRKVNLFKYATLSSKPSVLVINEKILDIRREYKMNFWMKFTEYGSKGPATVTSTGLVNGLNNLRFVFDNSFSAISEGKRTFYWNAKESTNYISDFYIEKDAGPVVTLYWHLEPSKLQ